LTAANQTHADSIAAGHIRRPDDIEPGQRRSHTGGELQKFTTRRAIRRIEVGVV
jgi:hypothetical protein